MLHHVDPVILRDPEAASFPDRHLHHVAEHRLRRRQQRRRARERWGHEHPALRLFTVDRDEVRLELTRHGH